MGPVAGRQKIGQFRAHLGHAENQLLRRRASSPCPIATIAAVLFCKFSTYHASQAAQDEQQQADDDARSGHAKG